MEHLYMEAPVRRMPDKKDAKRRQDNALPKRSDRGARVSLQERFGALGYTAGSRYVHSGPGISSLRYPQDCCPLSARSIACGSSKVIQPKLTCEYAQYAVTQDTESDIEKMRRYVRYMMKPELPMLEWIGGEYAWGRDTVARAARLVQQLKALPDSPSRLSQIDQLSQDIIDLEDRTERDHPEAYAAKESEHIYPSSEVSLRTVKERTDSIFSDSAQDRRVREDHPDEDGYLHSVAVLTFTAFRSRFQDMQGLLNIMEQIYTSWHLDQVVDRRTQQEIAVRKSTPDEVGAIRCIHTDTNPGGRIEGDTGYRIPGRRGNGARHVQQVPPALPDHARQYHDHVTQHAIYGADNRKPPAEIDADVRSSGKFLVEYSGIPFGGEPKPHNNKLVFDYLRGDMYVTFDHYKAMIKVDMKR